MAVQRGVRMVHDQTTRPLQDMRWEMFTLLAHGAFVTMIDKTAYDGWLDPLAYDRIGVLLAEAREKRAHFGQAPVGEVGIYFSTPTRDGYGRDDPPRYYQSVQGAHKAWDRPYVLPGLIEDAPLFRANLEFRDRIRSANALNQSTQIKRRRNRVTVIVEDIHDVIQCRY